MNQGRVDALSDVNRERDNQDARWGPIHERLHSYGLWLTVLQEEIGEASRAALEGDDAALRRELVQAAAVAVAMIESFDCGGCRGGVEMMAAVAADRHLNGGQ